MTPSQSKVQHQPQISKKAEEAQGEGKGETIITQSRRSNKSGGNVTYCAFCGQDLLTPEEKEEHHKLYPEHIYDSGFVLKGQGKDAKDNYEKSSDTDKQKARGRMVEVVKKLKDDHKRVLENAKKVREAKKEGKLYRLNDNGDVEILSEKESEMIKTPNPYSELYTMGSANE